MAKKRIPISKNERLAVYLRDGMACCWCGQTVEDGAELSLDHLICQKYNGADTADNLVTACRRCNSARGCRSVEEFAAGVAAYLNVEAEAVSGYVWGQAKKDLAPYRREAMIMRSRRNPVTVAEE